MRNHASDRTSRITGRRESTLLSENAGYTLSGGEMRVVRVTHEPLGALPEHAVAYLDSG